jgi:hypothetical protein
MIKKLGVLLVLCVLAAIGLKGYLSYAAMQFVEHLKKEHERDISLTYSWLSADFQGNVSFEDLVITPYTLKRPIRIDEAQVQFGSLGALISGAKGLISGRLAAPVSIKYEGLSMPLKGRSLDEWLALSLGEKVFVPMKLYACGERTQLDFSAMTAMGIAEIRAGGQVHLVQESGKEMFRAITNIDKIGKLDLTLELSHDTINNLLQKGKIEEPIITNLALTYQDAGYYRRLTNLCTAHNDMDIEVYADLSAKHWRLEMANIGILLDEEAENIYRDRLLQGGVFSVSATPKNALNLNQLDVLLDKEFSSIVDLKISLNNRERQAFQMYIDGKHYRPAPIVEEKKDNSVQATVILRKSDFQKTELEALPSYIERKVRIQLLDGKNYQGLLKSADEFKLEVTLLFDSGTADYFFANEKIEYVEVWRELDSSDAPDLQEEIQ